MLFYKSLENQQGKQRLIHLLVRYFYTRSLLPCELVSLERIDLPWVPNRTVCFEELF